MAVVVDVLIGLWAAVGLLLVVRRELGISGWLILAGAAVAAVGRWSDASVVALGLVPALGLHFLLALPDGRLGSTPRKVLAAVGYAFGAAVAIWLWIDRPGISAGPPAVEAASFAVVGTLAVAARYHRVARRDRQRIKWLGWAAVVAVGLAVITLGLRVLVDWPHDWYAVAAGTTGMLPIGLALSSTTRAEGAIDRLLSATISLAGLTAVVVGVYLAILLGLGRVPHKEERTLLVLSMLAAAVAALLYLPAHSRLKAAATRLVYGERAAPDEVLRTFGSRLSRSVPLDELLLQMAESLRKTLGLRSAEVWTATPGALELAVSDPERDPARLPLTTEEEATVARAGVSGPGWIKVWMPDLLAGRSDAVVRTVPIMHSGELLGLIVVDRPPSAETFAEEDERILRELARQVGLTLHNVRLDSALQASLDEVRRQAEALQASRGRIVAAADAERRRIERNLHDGAQQHLVALAVKVRLAKQLSEKDPVKAGTLLDELGGDLEDALQELRDLAHGIYPPLLADKGLGDALAAAARRASLPTDVRSDGVRRYPPEVEAAVYFCCLEALQNAGKHAGDGARAVVRVWEEEGGLLFEVADDGAGFDTHRAGASGGFTNMNDRLGAIGGSLRIESAPGRGTKVSGVIPSAT